MERYHAFHELFMLLTNHNGYNMVMVVVRLVISYELGCVWNSQHSGDLLSSSEQFGPYLTVFASLQMSFYNKFLFIIG